MADSLGLDVIAEGIETETQRKQLLRLGLSLGQGFLFAKPANLEEVCGQQLSLAMLTSDQPCLFI